MASVPRRLLTASSPASAAAASAVARPTVIHFLRRFNATAARLCSPFSTSRLHRSSLSSSSSRRTRPATPLSIITGRHDPPSITPILAPLSTSTSEKATTPTVAPLSRLSTRQLADLEERALSSISSSVTCPILQRSVGTHSLSRGSASDGGSTSGRTRRDAALGWVRSVAIRSAYSADVGPGANDIEKGSSVEGAQGGSGAMRAVVTVRPPTRLHPSLSQIVAGIEEAVRGAIADAARDEPSWPWTMPPSSPSASTKDKNKGEADRIARSVPVEVIVVPSRPFPAAASTSAAERDDLIKRLGPGLANVAHCLAVYSCKGGVGKSTVAVNLAYELARRGGRIGLLDADVHGPSLPVLVKPDDMTVRRSTIGPGVVLPIEHQGVKLLSLGYVSPDSGVPGSGPGGGAAVLRGPMASRVVTQLLKGTEWGDLDVLVLDLPPGTGDVPLSICQELELSGAVAVTTPSKLALEDARKGIEMFQGLGVPTLAAVENMAHFDCEGGVRHYPFGRGLMLCGDDDDGRGADNGGLPHLNLSRIIRVPISAVANDANDDGTPLCLARPEGAEDVLAAFADLADVVSTELLQLQHGQSMGEAVNGEDDRSPEEAVGAYDVASTRLDLFGDAFVVRLFSDAEASEVVLTGEELRSRDPRTGERQTADSDGEQCAGNGASSSSSASRSGGCGDEGGMVQHYNQKREPHEDELPELFPLKVDKKGRYGYAVDWADGATIIYSMAAITKVASEKIT